MTTKSTDKTFTKHWKPTRPVRLRICMFGAAVVLILLGTMPEAGQFSDLLNFLGVLTCFASLIMPSEFTATLKIKHSDKEA